jgi:hypothetical protein
MSELIVKEPQVIEQKLMENPIKVKADKLVNLALDAKLDKGEDALKGEFATMDWDKYSRVIARLRPGEKERGETNITVMQIIAMSPVAITKG